MSQLSELVVSVNKPEMCCHGEKGGQEELEGKHAGGCDVVLDVGVGHNRRRARRQRHTLGEVRRVEVCRQC